MKITKKNIKIYYIDYYVRFFININMLNLNSFISQYHIFIIFSYCILIN